jgi:hypothetical protein
MAYNQDCELLLQLLGWVVTLSSVLVFAGCMSPHLENMVIVLHLLCSYLRRLYVSPLMHV